MCAACSMDAFQYCTDISNTGSGAKDGNNRPAALDLSMDMIRVFVINDRGTARQGFLIHVTILLLPKLFSCPLTAPQILNLQGVAALQGVKIYGIIKNIVGLDSACIRVHRDWVIFVLSADSCGDVPEGRFLLRQLGPVDHPVYLLMWIGPMRAMKPKSWRYT